MNRLLNCIIFYFLISYAYPQNLRLGLPLGHTASIYSAQFSQDGKLVVTASKDMTARIWEVNTGRLLNTLMGHVNEVYSAQFSQNGKYIATASADSTAGIWEVCTGKLLHKLNGHHNEVYAVQFSRDGKKLVTASGDYTARIWDVTNGNLQFILKGHSYWINSAQFSPNGKLVVTASWDSTAAIWDADNGNLLFLLKGHSSQVISAHFSPEGKQIVTLSKDGTACIWDVSTGKHLITFKSQIDNVQTAQFSSDNKQVLIYTKCGATWILEAKTGKLTDTREGYTTGDKSAQLSPDGKKAIIFSGTGSAKILDTKTREILQNLEGHTSFVFSAQFSPDGKQLLSTSNDTTARIWDPVTGRLLFLLPGFSEYVKLAQFSTDGKRVATSTMDGITRIWDAKTGKQIKTLEGFAPEVKSVHFSPDNKKLVVASTDGNAYIWDADTGNLIHIFEGHTYGINSAIFSPDSKLVVTASMDHTARIWDANTGRMLNLLQENTEWLTLEGPPQWDYNAIFSPDGKQVITALNNSSAYIWDVNSGNKLFILTGHNSDITSVEFSPDGMQIVTASRDSTARIWNTNTGKLLFVLNGHTGIVRSAKFSPDGKSVVTASDDKSARVWDTKTGNLLQVLEEHTEWVKTAQYSPDGKEIITASFDGSFILWDALSGKMIVRNFVFDLGNNESGYIWLMPDGFYMGHKNAIRKLYYLKGLNTMGFDQLDIKYNRPDLVLISMGKFSDDKDSNLIKSYYRAYLKRIKKLNIDTSSFNNRFSIPESDIINRNNIDYDQTLPNLKIHISGNDSSCFLDRFNVWINDVPLFGQGGFTIRNKRLNSFDTLLTVDLSYGKNKIETSVTNINGIESYRLPLFVKYAPKKLSEEKVFFIGIGLNEYSDKGYNLSWSVKDIRDFHTALKGHYGNNLHVDTLFNKQATLKNISELKRKLLKTNVNDKVIISFSGHGLLSKDYDYYLSTYDIDFRNPQTNGLLYENFEDLLDSIPARRKLLFVDACHSGEIDKDEIRISSRTTDSLSVKSVFASKGAEEIPFNDHKLGLENSRELMQELFVNVQKGTGATVISAAGGDQYALESHDLQNGVFTFVILDFFKNNSTISVNELKNYLITEVEKRTGGLQKPTMRKENPDLDWYIW